MEELRYLYRIDIGRKWLAVAFFAACSLYGIHMAQATDRGLIIDGIIRLNIEQARWFNWGIAALCVGMTAYGIFGIIFAPTETRYVRLTADAISAPKGHLSRTEVKIPYAQITKLELQTVYSQRFLVIRHAGKKLTVSQVALPSRARFDELCNTLAGRVQAAKAPAGLRRSL